MPPSSYLSVHSPSVSWAPSSKLLSVCFILMHINARPFVYITFSAEAQYFTISQYSTTDAYAFAFCFLLVCVCFI